MLSLSTLVLICLVIVLAGSCFWLTWLYSSQKKEIGQLKDLTRKKTKKEQRKTHSPPKPPFEQVLNLIAGGIIISNREGELIWYNREAAEIIDLTTDDLGGRSIMSILSSLPMLISDSAGGAEVAPSEFDLNGRKIQGMIHVLYGNDGLDRGTVAVLNDVTTWHAALRTKQKQLDTLNYELRQQLTSMGSYTELLKDNTSEQGKAWLPRLHENVGRVTELIDTIMQVTAVKENGDLAGLVPVHVPQIIHETLDFLKPELEERKIYLKLQFDKEMRPVMAQRVHIQTILKELLTNSIRFNRPGGMVQIKSDIQKEDESDQEFLVLQIIDDGQGIPTADQKKIFDVFYRPEANIDSKHRNIGVGLAIVQAIVQAYEGRIWFRSQPEKGTVFTILLPAGQLQENQIEFGLHKNDGEFDWVEDLSTVTENTI